MNAKLNKRERRAQQLLAHYATCERLARYLGVKKPDGKKISVFLFKLERLTSAASVRYCNGEITSQNWEDEVSITEETLRLKFGGTIPPGFFVNSDPRGYALKIDNENPEGKALIEAVKLHTDWGGYGILSPAITGD